MLLQDVIKKLRVPNAQRIFAIRDAMQLGMTVDEIHKHSYIDPWFLNNIKEILDFEEELKKAIAN